MENKWNTKTNTLLNINNKEVKNLNLNKINLGENLKKIQSESTSDVSDFGECMSCGSSENGSDYKQFRSRRLVNLILI